jgi:hypothetical protein
MMSFCEHDYIPFDGESVSPEQLRGTYPVQFDLVDTRHCWKCGQRVSHYLATYWPGNTLDGWAFDPVDWQEWDLRHR